MVTQHSYAKYGVSRVVPRGEGMEPEAVPGKGLTTEPQARPLELSVMPSMAI